MISYQTNILCFFVMLFLCCCSKDSTESTKPKKKNFNSYSASKNPTVYFDNNSSEPLKATINGNSFDILPWSYAMRKLEPGNYEITFDRGKKYYELEVEKAAYPKTYILDPLRAGKYYIYRVYYSSKGTPASANSKTYSNQSLHVFTVHFLIGQSVPTISFTHQGERFVLRKILPKPMPWALVTKLLKELNNKKFKNIYNTGWHYPALVAACSKDISYAKKYLFPNLRLYQANTRSALQRISPQIFAKCATPEWIEEILPKLTQPRKAALAMGIYNTVVKLANLKQLEQIFPYFTKFEKERLLRKISTRPLNETQNFLILALKDPKQSQNAMGILQQQKDLNAYPQVLEALDKQLLDASKDPSKAYSFISLANFRMKQGVKNPQLLAAIENLLVLALNDSKNSRNAIKILKQQKDLSPYSRVLETLDQQLLDASKDPKQAYRFIDLASLRIEQVAKNPQLLDTIDKLLKNKRYNRKQLLTIRLKADEKQTDPSLVNYVVDFFRSRRNNGAHLMPLIKSQEIHKGLAQIFARLPNLNRILSSFIASKKDARGVPFLIAASKNYTTKNQALKHMAELPWLNIEECQKVLIRAVRQRSIRLSEEKKQQVLNVIEEQIRSAPPEELVDRWFNYLAFLDSRDGINIVIKEFSKLASGDKRLVKEDLTAKYGEIKRKYRSKILTFIAGGEVSMKRPLPYVRLLTAESPELRLDSFRQLAKLIKTSTKIKSRLAKVAMKEKNPKIKKSMEYQLYGRKRGSRSSRRSTRNRFARSSKSQKQASSSRPNYEKIRQKKEELAKLSKKLPKNRTAKSKLLKYLTDKEKQIAEYAMSLLRRHLGERDLRTLLKKYSKCPERVRSDIASVAARHRKSNTAVLILKKAAYDEKDYIRRSAYSSLLSFARTSSRAKGILKSALAREKNQSLKESYQRSLKKLRK